MIFNTLVLLAIIIPVTLIMWFVCRLIEKDHGLIAKSEASAGANAEEDEKNLLKNQEA